MLASDMSPSPPTLLLCSSLQTKAGAETRACSPTILMLTSGDNSESHTAEILLYNPVLYTEGHGMKTKKKKAEMRGATC